MKTTTSTSAPIETFYQSLVEFLVLSKQQLFGIARSCGLTNVQTLSLLFVGPDKPQPMHSLSKFLGCDASNVTGIIDGMERKKLMSRVKHPADRRIKMVQLEPAGLEVRQHIIDSLSTKDNFIISKLNKSELVAFVSLLQKIITT
jgi:DNA-binding MarR family transcriptional regulator